MSFPRFAILFFFLLVAFLSSSSVSAAQALNYKIFTTRDGLAGDYITAIKFDFATDTHWVGTTEGATHIAPTRWTSYTRAHGLGDSWITAIDISSDGRVWFGTQSGGVSVLHPISKSITTYNLENSDLPSNFITTLAVDSQDRVWVGTLNNGVAQFDSATGKWNTSLPDTSVTFFFVAFDESRTPWLVADGRVYAWHDEQWQLRALPNNEQAIRLSDGHRNTVAITRERMYVWNGAAWEKYIPLDDDGAPYIGILKSEQITAQEEGIYEDVWYGTARGLYVIDPPSTFEPPQPLPVLLIHGWTVAGDDTLETSEFRFLASYADRDGIPMYYARGVSPKNTLYQNAAVIRDEITRVKNESGADKVNLVAFSMGGMNTRAYLESSLYANDVHRAIILGTPQAGVEIWKPILFQQILQKPDEPSAIELSPEYAQMIVNQTRSPNPNVLYDLLIGDAREQTGLAFLDDMPASDALISVHSALALDAPNVRKHINNDLHDWGPEAVPIDLTGYLYPRETWERYLRNALRNNDTAPIGSEITSLSPAKVATPTSNHTPVITQKIRAGETITNSVVIDENKSARFVAYYPGGEIDFSLIAPDGQKFEPSDLPRDENGVLTLSTDIASFSGYVVKNATVGEWQMILSRTDTRNNIVDASTYVELDSSLRILVQPVDSKASAMFPVTLAVQAPNDATVTARVAIPNNGYGEGYDFLELALYDDGGHDDGAADDGTFANEFKAAVPGWHLAQVQAIGNTFAREGEILFPVSYLAEKIEFQSDWEISAQAENQVLDFSAKLNWYEPGNYGFAASLREDNNKIIARQFFLTDLREGENLKTFALSFQNPLHGKLHLDLELFDLNWAAYSLGKIQDAAIIQQ